jgi:asparagine synthase (glutamine-hydrolysing)
METIYKTYSKDTPLKLERLTLGRDITIVATRETVTVDIKATSTTQLFYALETESFTVSNDLRRLYSGHSIDEIGLYSLLQFGASVPPYTLFKGIQAFKPGHRYTLDRTTFTLSCQPICLWEHVDSTESVETLLETTLQNYLKTTCENKSVVILFSGGVDSSLIASQLRYNITENLELVHYSNNDDIETRNARAIAKALSLTFKVTHLNDINHWETLTLATKLYASPFCDYSNLSTYALSKYVMDNYPSDVVVLDGTGADGAWGMQGKIARLTSLYRYPQMIFKIGALTYRWLALWRRPSRAESYLKVLKRATTTSLLTNLIARDPMAGIGYHFDTQIIQKTNDAFQDWIAPLIPDTAMEVHIPVLDLLFVCTRIFAQKTHMIFQPNHYQVYYPFLEVENFKLALQNTTIKRSKSATPKAPLKTLLAKAVPQELVYRPKSGFVPPLADLFAHSVFLEQLAEVLDSASPLNNYVDQPTLRKLHRHLKQRRLLPQQTYNFLWSVAFTHAWLKGLST